MPTSHKRFNSNLKLYSAADHNMWNTLYSNQVANLQSRVNSVFLKNLANFNLPVKNIPDLADVSEKLYAANGWMVEPVSGLIGYEEYFTLLAQRNFPVAEFIRTPSEKELSKDPDIFHEIFGHCTMLLSQDYADFMTEYAKFALTIPKIDRPMFARLIWFTTETGLIKINNQNKIYGSSILSSYKESEYCLEDQSVIRKPFDVISIFREPYRADILQKVYYVLDNGEQVYNLLSNISHLFEQLDEARNLGEFTALFPIVKNKYSNIGHCKKLELLEGLHNDN
jgi:phenylalanine-4-hydroxylase